MVYVALLRGINVGGNRTVEMPRLKATLEQTGLSSVRTYINSGNAIFRDESRTPRQLVELLEGAIEQAFGFDVKVLVRDLDNMKAVAEALPASWVNDRTMKCDVMFLSDDVDDPGIVEQLDVKPEIEDVKYVKGAVLRRVDRDNVTKSAMMKLVGTDLYSKMTVRNCNTARKLVTLMEDVSP